MSQKKPNLKDRALAAILPSGAAPLPAAVAAPRTGPGALMAHLARESDAQRENERLRDELNQWEGAKATRLLDPKLVGWSVWANRDQANFDGPDFLELKQEIASAGGNVQPIKVRVAKPGGEHEYEIVFGHRRHRACLELGLPVLAVIDNLGEVDLFVQMDRENRSRKNLSAWEQGMMYLRALEKGLFPSNRKLAEEVGVDLGQVGKAISLAKLPAEVIEAFASPLDLQFRWAKPLADAAERDLAGLVKRAKKAKSLGADRSAKDVLDVLLMPEGEGGGTVQPPPIVIQRNGKEAASISLDAKGRATVSFAASVVGPEQMNALSEHIEAFIAKAAKAKK
jgi:ParB family transcriptional regulator, chromosome partitioning protein